MRRLSVVMFLLLMNLPLCAGESADIKSRYYFPALSVDSSHSTLLMIRNHTPTMLELKVQFIGARWKMKNYMGSGRTALVADPSWIFYITPGNGKAGWKSFSVSQIALMYQPEWHGILKLSSASSDFDASVITCPAAQKEFDSNCRELKPTLASPGQNQNNYQSFAESLEEAKNNISQQQKKLNDLKQHFDAGNSFLQSRQYEQALAEFQQAAQIDPAQYVVFGRLADTYSAMGKYDEAATNFQKAITLLESKPDLKPNTKQNLAGYYNNYGGVLAKQGKFKEAMETYQKAATVSPDNAGMFYYNMGAALTNSHAPVDDRIAAFKKATESNPKNANAWYYYGLTLSEKMTVTPDRKVTAPPEMIWALNKYLELDPQGKYAEGAKRLIQAAGQTVTTSIGTKKDATKNEKK